MILTSHDMSEIVVVQYLLTVIEIVIINNFYTIKFLTLIKRNSQFTDLIVNSIFQMIIYVLCICLDCDQDIKCNKYIVIMIEMSAQ